MTVSCVGSAKIHAAAAQVKTFAKSRAEPGRRAGKQAPQRRSLALAEFSLLCFLLLSQARLSQRRAEMERGIRKRSAALSDAEAEAASGQPAAATLTLRDSVRVSGFGR